MTTRAEMAELATTNAETIAELRRIGTRRTARATARIERCTQDRLTARGRWPRCCGSPGCAWCVRPLVAGWARGLAGGAVATLRGTTVKIDLGSRPGEIRQAVRYARRALRNLRDRAGRRPGGTAWRGVTIYGIAGSDGLHLGILHHGILRDAVLDALRRVWNSAEIDSGKDISFEFSAADRAELSMIHRGLEPLRVTISPQGVGVPRSLGKPRYVDPMPFVF